MSVSENPTKDSAGPKKPADEHARIDRYWDQSRSGAHQVSRPIVVDGLQKPVLKIELAPRIRWINGEFIDDSYHAVENATSQLVYNFSVEQLVMATVALRVHMRKSKAHIDRKRVLQEEWTELARRMKKLKILDEHLTFEEERLSVKTEEPAVAAGLALQEPINQLLAIERADLAGRRAEWRNLKESARRRWYELEKEDELLMSDAPHLEQTQDLRSPYILTLLSGGDSASRRKRSLASAMHTFVQALQKPLSRTDQMLLEIALRRCIRASAPAAEAEHAEEWERRLLSAAEDQFAAEFGWARSYVRSASSETNALVDRKGSAL